MKAVICTAYGAPEVLRIAEIEKPQPKDREVLIKIMATAVNSGDVRVRGLAVGGFLRILMRFVLGFTKPRKPVLGNVLSGVVEAVGKDVQNFKPGDAVFAATGFRFGAYADYIALPEKGPVALKPANAAFAEAAAILFGGTTALYFLHKAGIASGTGKQVLVYGATGSVGVAAIQVARYYGARVTAVCSEEGAQLATAAGSDAILLYTHENFTRLEQRFDIVFDAVGKAPSACKKLLKPGGRYSTVGGLEVAKETKQQLLQLKRMFEAGALYSFIEKTYPFSEIVAAHAHVDSGRKKGNVVIQVN